MYQKIKNYYIKEETVLTIGQFAVLWGMIEEKYYNKCCTAAKLSNTVICAPSWQLVLYADEIKRELFAINPSKDSSQFRRKLCIRRPDQGFWPQIERFLMNDAVNENEKIFAALCICFRIRNNMFHGEKIFWLINDQKDLLDSCARFMNELLMGEDVILVR